MTRRQFIDFPIYNRTRASLILIVMVRPEQGCQKGRGPILYLSSQPWKIFASSGGLVEDQKISRCTKIQPIWFIRGLGGPKGRGPRPAAAGRATALGLSINLFLCELCI
ncbi:hypothetical protein CRE_05997 [Caenorhabditis remanei]|uniref:Uncharacterized protein n=1 Tax=Caenorhabditis remanei TaxID=31234 RepID=E3MZG9_CAERE|nr:hypothetical protein CRE_05997 [Caenorhabditis remanei]